MSDDNPRLPDAARRRNRLFLAGVSALFVVTAGLIVLRDRLAVPSVPPALDVPGIPVYAVSRQGGVSMTWWLWVVVGLILLALEMATPGGFFIAFFGVAALLVGLLTGMHVLGPVWLQWLLFSIISVASVMFFRKPLLEWMKKREPQRPAVDTLVGETAIVSEDIAAGGVGKAELRGTSWTVRSRAAEALRRGQRCRVEQVDGLTLWVKAESIGGNS